MDLANYNDHLCAIHRFAYAIGIKIKFTEEDCHGMYQPSVNRIKIDRDLENCETIATLLHELGHCLDESLHSEADIKNWDWAYRRVYKDRMSKKASRIVLGFEKRAWKYARGIAKRLKIPLGKWFDYEEAQALLSYSQDL